MTLPFLCNSIFPTIGCSKLENLKTTDRNSYRDCIYENLPGNFYYEIALWLLLLIRSWCRLRLFEIIRLKVSMPCNSHGSCLRCTRYRNKSSKWAAVASKFLHGNIYTERRCYPRAVRCNKFTLNSICFHEAIITVLAFNKNSATISACDKKRDTIYQSLYIARLQI